MTKTLSRFGIVAMIVGITLAFAAPVAAAHTITIDPYDETAHGCGDDAGFKLEAEWLVEGEHSYELIVDGEVVFTATLDVALDEDGEVDSIVVISTDPPASYVLVKAGTETHLIGEFDPAGQAISHIEFCFVDEEPTPTPTPTEEPTSTPTDEATPTPVVTVPTPPASPGQTPPTGTGGTTPPPALPDTATAALHGQLAIVFAGLFIAALGVTVLGAAHARRSRQ